MESNKRYLNEKIIRNAYEEGYKKLERFIRKHDALIIEDEFSQKIVDLIIDGDAELRIKTLMN